jgi:Ca2+-binding RTX toxin-like protein
MSYPTSTILVPRRGSANESTITTTLVIFDSQVADLSLLYKALLPGSIGHTIQPDQDSIDTITQLLTQTGATKLAIVAHGQPGAIQIGSGKIDRAMLEARSGLLQEWGVDSIALYSCEVGADKGFIQRFGELTGAQISASTAKLGAGNWELDGGERMLEIGQLENYSSTLATFTGTSGNDTASNYLINFPSINGFTGGTLAELNDATGDTFSGLDGDDYVYAASGNDTLYGNSGNDTLNGGDGINYLNGGDGDDWILVGYSMRDTVDGGIGNDFLYIRTPLTTDAITLEFTGANAGKFKNNGTETGTFTDIEQLLFGGGNGNDVIDASLANISVTLPGTAAGFGTFGLNIYGYSGSDTVLGSAGSDSIYGEADNDFLYGQGGDDTILGGTGFDIIYGGSGIDSIFGGGLNDTIFGGIGNDIISGEDGEDYLYGEEDNDTIKGGYGFDVIYGQAGNDIIYGEGVTLDAVGGDITTAPGSGVGINDTIFGGIGDDTIYGGIGDDYLLGEDGADRVIGGAGNDFIYGGIDGDTLRGSAGNDYIVGQDGIDQLYGDDGSDYLSGDAGNDIIYGGNDNDFLYGNVGIDEINGDAGNDFLDGGDGGDFLYGGDGSDTIFGVDGEDYLYGENGEDYLYGGIGNDSISGKGGTDFLIGGAGSDLLIGGADSDKFVYFAMTDAGDTITDFDVTPTGDKLNLSALFASIGVASGAVNTNYLQFTQSGLNTICQVDSNGAVGGANFVTIATLNNVTASLLSFAVGGNVLV